MKTTLIAALALFAAAAVAPSGNATPADCGSMTIDLGGQAYISQDEAGIPLWDSGLWIYAESNGQADLQRGGVTLLGDADTCQASATPDTGIF